LSCFNCKIFIEDTKIEYISSDVIYHITERVEKIVTWMLDPKEVEVILWKAKVGWIFFSDKKFMILGLVVPENTTIENNVNIRVLRKDKKIWTWKVASLKQWVEEVKQIEGPTECWIKFEWNVKVEEGDMLEFYKIEIQK
jgi:translation initiation factor IF-2